MGKYEANPGSTARENAEVEKAFRQVTGSSSAPKKPGSGKPTPKNTEARQKADKKRKIMIISICSAVLVLLITVIITVIALSGGTTDDGKILSNVYAGSVNLGGMTEDEARSALHLATDNSYTKKDMVITLADTSITLSPTDTGAKLDVDAVVAAAYSYGRTGSESELEQAKEDALTTNHTIALLPYLTLDLEYIETTIQEFCDSYSSVMTQPTVTIEGSRPAFDPEYPDLAVEHQTLTIVMGTPDYTLDASDLYDRVLDAYSLNELTVAYEAPTLTEPETPNAEALFSEFCVAPVDAVMNTETFEVTPEVYGYGFDIEAVQNLINKAGYGETIEIELDFIMPDITAEDLTGNMFLDTLASYTSVNSGVNSSERNTNLRLSCAAINDIVLKAGEEFSFNDVVGRLTALKSYQKASPYNNGEEENVLGGGVSQTASALYYCALMADLEIVERHSHNYAVDFIDLGLDAAIEWGAQDLRFRNNTKSPIRIVATADGGKVTIQLLGTNALDYTVQLKSVIVAQYDPLIIKQTMAEGNVWNYQDGDELKSGITGYAVETYKELYDALTGELIISAPVDTSDYSKRDRIVVSIGSEIPTVPDPTDPTDTTDPSEPTASTDPTDPSKPTESADPITDSPNSVPGADTHF